MNSYGNIVDDCPVCNSKDSLVETTVTYDEMSTKKGQCSCCGMDIVDIEQ